MSETILPAWLLWALLSAIFAALTAIFAKAGVNTIDSDLATFVRTVVIFVVIAGLVCARGLFSQLGSIPATAYTSLTLSGLATGASWLCYFKALQAGQASQVAPVDKLSVVLVAIFGVAFLGEHLSLQNWLGVILIVGGVVLVSIR